MDKYNLKDALLFISRGDTHEILIETNQRTRPDVQSNLQELLNYIRISTKSSLVVGVTGGRSG
uniref:Uncharacterized protein n=1 Tax=Escherichia coli TaxID=562 RepID=A0A3G4RTS2_ECOLX|nr:hypothetical protein D0368_00356 [Escherichia coli]